MEKKNIITDEQIASFLSGTATEEEKNTVLEYVAESDENLDELMSIAEVASNYRRTIHEGFKTPTQHSHHAVKHTILWRKPKPIVWRVAASVAVVLVSGGLLFALAGRGSNPETGNQFAIKTTDNPNNTSVSSEEEEALCEAMEDIQHPLRSNEQTLIAEANPEKEINDMFDFPTTTPQFPASSTRGGGVVIASSQVPGTPKTTDPLKTFYEMHIDVPSHWKHGSDLRVLLKCNAIEMRFVMRPKNGIVVFDTVFHIDKDSVAYRSIPSTHQAALIRETDTAIWHVTALFEDGKIEKKHGTIVVVK